MRVRKDHRFAKLGRTLKLACVFMLTAGITQAQAESEKAKDTLELKLSAPVTTLCMGTSIELGLEIKNITRETVKIDKPDLWNQYSYSTYSNGGGRSGGRSSSCSHCRGDFIVLYPGDTFWTMHKFSLDDQFFGKLGKYDIAVSINSAMSNKVEFELIDCGKN